ncbi:type I polyketide synthase, partial [Streptomyces sp. NPDC019531]|uniref:type I polyketide synthase n=1 Tax=Streptomyces sp. NPDC019531 TaxID=3365062 RepID=UPI00384A4E37
ASPNWNTLLPASTAAPTDLPTYPFQHQRYWPQPPAPATTTAGDPTGHPFLDAVLDHADSGGLLLTGRLSLDTHPWLADHTALGTVLLPGTALLELALRAGAEVDCDRVEELTLLAPLTIPSDGALHLQVSVGAADQSGARPVAVHSRADGLPPGVPWIHHAQGELVPGGRPQAPWEALRTWPPQDATPVPADGFYSTLAGLGLAYGPLFRGLRAVWQRGEERFAEVHLPDGGVQDARRFAVHPALLDAALQPVGLDGGEARLPFAWQGAWLRPAQATSLRVRLSPTGAPDTVAVEIADGEGRPVAAVRSLSLRAATAGQPGPATQHGMLLPTVWQALPTGTPDSTARLAVLGPFPAAPGLDPYPDLAALQRALDEGAPVPGAVLAPCPAVETPAEASARLLALLQAWLADERLAAARLVVVTRRAVATRPDEDVPDLVNAPLWGLVRTAQTEEPDRFVLLDVDDLGAALRAFQTSWRRDEPQLAVRAGTVLVPRLTRAATTSRSRPAPLDPDGTVLVTGGLGTLGSLTAKHLVRRYGARRLLLAGRRGPDTPGARELLAELAALGAEAEAVACDIGDREALRGLLAAVPDEHPLTAVVHTAGALDDGVLGALDPQRLRHVFRAKADGALHLHELTREHDLSMFVLFSSAAGVLGTPGQANYAAANAFLDALAQHRRAHGLPATALDWGFWAELSDLTRHVDQTDLTRLSEWGLAPLPSDEAFALLDAAVARPEPALVAARLDTGALRPPVPPLLRDLVRGADARRETPDRDEPGLADRLAGLPEAEQESVLLDLVRAQIATVLGYDSPTAVRGDRSFRELGLDSLGSVQLRNALGAALGSRLPVTVVFDHPHPLALARYLRTRLVDDGTPEVPGPDPEPELVAASDDELFAFIDQELGLAEEGTDDGE